MNALRRLRIPVRLGLGFGFLIVAIGVSNWAAGSRLNALKAKVDEIIEINNVQISLSMEMQLKVNQIALMTADVLNAETAPQKTALLEKITALRQEYDAHEVQLGKMFENPVTHQEERAAFDKLLKLKTQTRQVSKQVMDTAMQGRVAEAEQQLRATLRPLQNEWIVALKELATLESDLNAQAADSANKAFDQLRTVSWVFALGSLLCAGVTAWVITRSVTQPMTEAVGVATEIAKGNFAVNIVITGDDEATALLRSMQDMKRRLSGVVAGVRDGSHGVATASNQIAQSNNDLSARTDSQAQALQNAALFMEQLKSQVKNNAANAQQANALALNASNVAVQGSDVVEEVVVTMKGINDSSHKIADIIGVIDGIAFQTNILALNAAVEAARAGEQGRGFAVVASEVRSLAGRSADAAKEIKALIGDSVERVEQGTALVDRAGATMHEVVGTIQQVTTIMGEISAASAEQAGGVAQIGEAVSAIDQTTQQNAALVEQMAAASQSLNQQAQALVQGVTVFKLEGASADEDSARHSAHTPAAAALHTQT